MDLSEADPKGLVRESYRIEGITIWECRIIFLDWSLSLAAATVLPEAMRFLLAVYGAKAPGHPMNSVLEAGLEPAEPAQRRGGRAGRLNALRP